MTASATIFRRALSAAACRRFARERRGPSSSMGSATRPEPAGATPTLEVRAGGAGWNRAGTSRYLIRFGAGARASRPPSALVPGRAIPMQRGWAWFRPVRRSRAAVRRCSFGPGLVRGLQSPNRPPRASEPKPAPRTRGGQRRPPSRRCRDYIFRRKALRQRSSIQNKMVPAVAISTLGIQAATYGSIVPVRPKADIADVSR